MQDSKWISTREPQWCIARGGTLDNLAVRGMLPVGFAVHEQARIVAVRMFTPGLSEVIIGRALVGRYPGCNLGSSMCLGRRPWTVVGAFEADGSSFESEKWGDAHTQRYVTMAV